MSCVRLEGFRARYGTGPPVLEVGSLEFAGGTTTALIGPNGAGKSTLLHVVAGLLPRGAGSVTVGSGTPARNGVAMVYHWTNLDAGLPLTVAEVVAMGRYPHRGLIGRFRREDHRAIGDSMTRLEIVDLARRQLAELSGGQRQRVLTARALAQQAEVLLLDEVHTGLDATSEILITRAVDEERDRGAVVIAATHDLEVAARADQVVLLAGRAMAWGPAAEVLVPARLAAVYGPGAFEARSGEPVPGPDIDASLGGAGRCPTPDAQAQEEE